MTKFFLGLGAGGLLVIIGAVVVFKIIIRKQNWW